MVIMVSNILCVHTCMCIYVYVYMYIYVYMYMYMYMYMHMYMYVYVCIYIYTYGCMRVSVPKVYMGQSGNAGQSWDL